MLHLTPLPDTYLDQLPPSEGPASRYELGESVQLAFLTAIQLLTPRQRAVLILRDVLDFTAKEAADMMGVSVASVTSALQRARGTLKQERGHGRLETRSTELSSAAERSLVRRFVEAWQGVDIEGLVAILTDDAVLTMPPFPMRYVGREPIKEFFTRVPAGGELDRFRLVTTRANGQPAVAAYLFDPESGTHRAYGIMVLSLDGEAVHEITGFSHPSLFASFGLAMQYDAGD
jgi:RNA polymerase sigma-70 factor (ECF subfamily)